MRTKHRPLTTEEAPMKRWWSFYVAENPMKIEIQRIIRRFFIFNTANQTNAAFFGLILLLFGIMTIWTMNARGTVDPMTILAIYTVLMLLLNPLLFHSTIAGERERRSWDMLLVAPVTHGQIIVGKILASFMLNAGVLILFLVPLMIAGITYRKTYWPGLLGIALACLATMLSSSAMTVLLSARAKRPLVSLGTSLGATMVFYLLLPIFAASIAGMYGTTSQFLFVWHPFTLFSMYSLISPRFQMMGSYEYSTIEPGTFYLSAGTAVGFHVFLGLALAVWSIKTLVFADNEVRFIGRGPKGASSKA